MVNDETGSKSKTVRIQTRTGLYLELIVSDWDAFTRGSDFPSEGNLKAALRYIENRYGPRSLYARQAERTADIARWENDGGGNSGE